MGVTKLALTIGNDIFTAITQPIIDNKETIKNSFQDLIDGLAEVTSTTKAIFTDILDFIFDIYQNIILPIIQNIQQNISKLISEHIAPLFTQVGEFLNKLGSNIKIFWDTILKPLIDWIIKNILPVVIPIVNGVLNAVFAVIGGITDLISGLLEILGGLIDFVVGVFTGDWEKAWNGIKDIFSGIINSITAILETFINKASGLINGIIGGVNKITGAFGISEIPEIPELNIPKLATGAVIPPNAPFMAMLGDQRHGTNIEAPLDTIKQAVMEVIGNGFVNAPIHAHLYLDGREIYDCVIDQGKMHQLATGKNQFATL